MFGEISRSPDHIEGLEVVEVIFKFFSLRHFCGAPNSRPSYFHRRFFLFLFLFWSTGMGIERISVIEKFDDFVEVSI